MTGGPLRVTRQRTDSYNMTMQPEDEVVLHYQPIIELDSGRTWGVEALVRLLRVGQGLVPPSVFVPLAEESDLILRLGTWVLRTASREVAGLGGLEVLRLAVNLSPRQLADPAITSSIPRAVEGSGIGPSEVVLEITETPGIDDLEGAAHLLGELREMGFTLAVDNFGMGYASTAYLQQLPIDIVKIHKSFVDVIGVDPRKAALTAGVLGLAHDLGMRTVAVGIERGEELEVLLGLGCEYGQGFYFSEPLELEDLRHRVATERFV